MGRLRSLMMLMDSPGSPYPIRMGPMEDEFQYVHFYGMGPWRVVHVRRSTPEVRELHQLRKRHVGDVHYLAELVEGSLVHVPRKWRGLKTVYPSHNRQKRRSRHVLSRLRPKHLFV